MRIPLGDLLRGLKLPGWLRTILNLTKGSKVTVGGTEVLLNQDPRVFPAGRSPLDSTPHKPGPPPVRGRTR